MFTASFVRSLHQKARAAALWIVVAVLAAGVAVAVAAFVAERDAGQKALRQDAEEHAVKIVLAVRQHLDENLVALDAVAGLYALYPRTTQEGLTAFLRATRLRGRLRDAPIAWAPRSTAAGAADDAGFVVAAVESRAPDGLLGMVPGSDLAADPRWRDALRSACASSEPRLVRGLPDTNAAGQYVLLRAVRSLPAAPGSGALCSSVIGFVVGVANFEAELRDVLAAQPGIPVTVALTDLSERTAGRVFVATDGDAGPVAATDVIVLRSDEMDFGGRRFNVSLVGDRSRIVERPGRGPLPMAVGALALAVAVALAFLAWIEHLRRRAELEHRVAAEAISATERRWRTALEGIGDAVWDLNVVTGAAYFSPRYAEMLGYDAETFALTMAQFEQLLHPDDAARVGGALRELFAGRDTRISIDARLRCADGSYRWMSGRGAVQRDADGTALRLIGTNTDIEARMTVMELVREHESELDAIVTSAPEGTVAFAADNTVKLANPAFLEAIGLEASAVVGLPQADFEDLLTGRSVRADDDRGCLSCPGARARAALPPAGEGEPPRRCGSCRLEIVHPRHRVYQRARVTLASHSLSAIEYFHDVTAQVEVDRIKSEFLATAAHELRTPMTSIYGFSEILATMDCDQDQAREFGATINAQAESLVLLLNELLDLARIEARAGRAFDFAEVALADVIRPAIAELRPRGDARPVDVDLGDREFRVLADKDRLKQAVTNILGNAFKYSFGKGRVTLTLFGREVEQGRQVGIRVTDEGIGMTEEQLTHVFERFWRADKSGGVPGTGLGLSLVKETLAYHRGSVEVHSEPGAGTQVVLWLPLAEAPRPAVVRMAVASAA